MSYQRALQAIHLQETDRTPQIEHLHHTQFVRRVSGLEPSLGPDEALAAAHRALDLDLIFYTEGGFVPEAEKGASQYADTDFGVKPSTWRLTYPFKTVDDVLRYDPWPEQKKLSFRELVQRFADGRGKWQSLVGNATLVPGGYYTTLFMWGIQIFGLELFALAAASEPKRCTNLIERFAEVSMRDVEAWAEAAPPAFISHDDLAMTCGPIFHPNWLRTYIFPWYPKIWKPIKDKGIKVLFCSDGNYTALFDDIAAAGADGFIIEPSCDLQYLANNFGATKVIIGNISTEVLTHRSKDAVVAEVRRCVDTAGHCLGYFFNAAGGITHNIPIENVETYFAACRQYGRRNPVVPAVSRSIV